MPIHTRNMQTADLVAIWHVQSQCYPPAYLENTKAFAAKLAGAPHCSWIAWQSNDDGDGDMAAQAYLVCLPVDDSSFPVLNAPEWRAPSRPTMLYLHDLAVAPALQGTGTGAKLVALAHQQAKAMALPQMALVAVQGSLPYWERLGFQAQGPQHPELARALASFGSEARFMLRPT